MTNWTNPLRGGACAVDHITKCKFWDCIESAKIAARDIFDQDEQISHICNLKYIQIVNSCHNIMYGYIYIETYDSKYRSLETHDLVLTLYTTS